MTTERTRLWLTLFSRIYHSIEKHVLKSLVLNKVLFKILVLCQPVGVMLMIIVFEKQDD